MGTQKYNEYDDEREGSQSFDFMRFYYALKERAWIVALAVVAAGIVTYAYLKRAPQIYAATVILQVELERPIILKELENVQPTDRSPEAGKSIERLLQSRALLERVLFTNNLAKDPRFLGEAKGPPPNNEKLIKKLEGMVNVQSQYGTRLLNLTVEHSDRDLAKEVATAVVAQFTQQNYEQHLAAVEAVSKLLSKDEERLRKKVEESDQALQAYRRASGSVSLQGSTDIVVQTLKDLNQKLNEAVAERTQLESEYQQVLKIGGDAALLLGLRAIMADPSVANCLAQLAQHEVEVSAVKNRYLPKHPKYAPAMSKLADWQQRLTNATLQAAQSLTNHYRTAQQTEASFRTKLTAQTEEVLRLSDQSIAYKNLERETKANTGMYETILTRMKETTMSKDWDQSKVSVFQPAYASEKPIRPERQRILVIGILLGLGVGLALALGLEVLDSTIKTPDQAEALLNLPILTAVPRLRSVETGHKHVVMSESGEGHGAEAFRTLRTSLSMLGPEGTRRTILFTSAVPEEGKTFCALNYAYSLGQQGLRTLLVEADLRCPAVEQALPFVVNAVPGLTDYLTNQSNFEAVVQPSDNPNLSVILAGTRSPNPSELLGQDGFSALIQEALLHFDRVVIDSAPVQPVSDTLLLVTKVQTVCLVVCADHAPRKAAQRAVQMMEKSEAPLVGIIFNRLSQTRGQHYYDYSYYPEYVERGVVKT